MDIAIAILLTIIIIKLFLMGLTQAELAAELTAIKTQNDKSRAEILEKIQDLEDALAAAGSTTQEVDDALAALKSSVQVDDDIVPDPE